jgi:uroporphyrinogen-III synthase
VRLLLTRPEPGAQRTAAALRAKGHDVVVAPLLQMETAADAPIGAGPWAAILVTSANAAHAIAAHARIGELRGVPVICVGERSAQAMRSAGFAAVASADGDVGDLGRFVAARMKTVARFLYLAGAERSGDLAGDLAARGHAVETVAIYRAVAAAALPDPAAEAISAGGITGVLHFSRRSARVFVDLARSRGLLAAALRPVQFCLSAQVAEPLVEAGAATVRIAPSPTEAALIELIGPP